VLLPNVSSAARRLQEREGRDALSNRWPLRTTVWMGTVLVAVLLIATGAGPAWFRLGVGVLVGYAAGQGAAAGCARRSAYLRGYRTGRQHERQRQLDDMVGLITGRRG